MFLKKIFGTSSTRYIKKVFPLVQTINDLYDGLSDKTDQDLIEVHFLEQGAFIDDYSAIHALNVVGEKYGKYAQHIDFNKLKPDLKNSSRVLC